jgi:hypothetical protein
MYMNKSALKEIASLINNIDTCEIAMESYKEQRDWEQCRRTRYNRNVSIIELTEKFKIPHVLYNNAVEQNRDMDK